MFRVRLLNPLKLKGFQSCSHNVSTTILALARNSWSSFIARDSGVSPDISGFAFFRIYHVQTHPDHVQTHEKTDNLLDTFS